MTKKTVRNAILVTLSIAILTIGILEVGSGYLLYRKQHGRDALFHAGELAYQKVFHKPAPRLRPWSYSSGGVRYESRDKNPFIPDGRIETYQFHPLIDFTGAFSWEEINGHLDYFGFRNDEDYYFQKSEDPLVVMTGGSEAGGGHHKVTIAKNLENILRERTGKHWRVLNLAMHSYTIPNEMNAFLHLGYNLKPKYVITHSSWNDLYYGLMVPRPFQELGLSYYLYQEGWLRRIYDTQATEVNSWRIIDLRNERLIVNSYFKNIAKFQNLVDGSGAKFIVGLQPFNKSFKDHPAMNAVYDRVHRLHAEVSTKAKDAKYVKFPDSLNLKFVDSIHTDWPGAKVVAQVYAEKILGSSRPQLGD